MGNKNGSAKKAAAKQKARQSMSPAPPAALKENALILNQQADERLKDLRASRDATRDKLTALLWDPPAWCGKDLYDKEDLGKLKECRDSIDEAWSLL